jgi:cell fate (sporulation/competence/biofilm development) regulator YlbF (YheA/YmcA/DUF963 family)
MITPDLQNRDFLGAESVVHRIQTSETFNNISYFMSALNELESLIEVLDRKIRDKTEQGVSVERLEAQLLEAQKMLDETRALREKHEKLSQNSAS